jgi:hypothetical protein
LREGRRLRVFENGVLRGIFGAKRDGAIGKWRKLHNEELHDGRGSSADWEGRGLYRVLVRKLWEIDHWGDGINSPKNYGFRLV